MGKHSQYGVILDAGSSGTRIYIYKWKNPAKAIKDASPSAARSLPQLILKRSKKIHPGVSSYVDDVISVGPEHLKSLIDVALDEVPSDKVSSSPIFLMATAGVRLLSKEQQHSLLQGICSYLQLNTTFHLPNCSTHIQVISGETEGLYGWIAANYLLGGFNHPESHDHGKGHHTYGFLDMGGASAQIAFAPNYTEVQKHSNDLKLVRMRRLDGHPIEHRIFTATWLGFGANKARARYVKSLQNQYGDDAEEIPDPCMPKGLRTTIDGDPLSSNKDIPDSQTLIGIGKFEECLRKTHPLLGKDEPCVDQPCLLNGQHVPAIDFDINRFIGVSEYWHSTHGFFGSKKDAYNLATYEHSVLDFCNRDWSVIEHNLKRSKKTAEDKAEEARQACFKASWLINVLYDGLGIPRGGLEGIPGPEINITKKPPPGAIENGFKDHFRPVNEIDGIEVTWTLGKMVLYAAGQVLPLKGSSLPVGFGSNVASGTPSDFERAGSVPIPLSADVDVDDSDDWGDEIPILSKSSTWSIAIILLVLLAVGYLLWKPERRRRLYSMASRRRRPGGVRKTTRGFSLARKIFGRNSAMYERVMEEGEATEFELGDMAGERNDSPDSSDGARAGRSVAGSRLNMGRFETIILPSVMDRNGMVVRTESRERLVPTLQMLNAGRRSRTGSPIRMKNPRAPPLEQC